MRKQPIRLGWLSLVMTVCIVCLAVLSVLAFTTARANLSFAQKQAQAVQGLYVLERQGQEWLAQTDAAAQAGMLPDGESTQRFEEGSRVLEVAVQVQGSRFTVTRWRYTTVWPEENPAESLWNPQ